LFRYPVSYFLGEESDSEQADPETLLALARAAGDLTDADREQVLKFANFLRHYRGEGG
jgi:hypothetical protein